MEVLANGTSDVQQRLDSMEALSYLVEPIDNANGEITERLRQANGARHTYARMHQKGPIALLGFPNILNLSGSYESSTDPGNLPIHMLLRTCAKTNPCMGCTVP